MRFIILCTTVFLYCSSSLGLSVNGVNGSNVDLDQDAKPVMLNNKLMGFLGGLMVGGMLGSSGRRVPPSGTQSSRKPNTPKGGYTTGGVNSGYISGPPPTSGVQYYGIQNCKSNCGSYYLPGYYNAGEYYGGHFPGGYFAGGYFLGNATTNGNHSANVTSAYKASASLMNRNWFSFDKTLLFCIGLGLVL